MKNFCYVFSILYGFLFTINKKLRRVHFDGDAAYCTIKNFEAYYI